MELYIEYRDDGGYVLEKMNDTEISFCDGFAYWADKKVPIEYLVGIALDIKESEG